MRQMIMKIMKDGLPYVKIERDVMDKFGDVLIRIVT